MEKYFPIKHGSDIVKQTTLNLQNMIDFTRASVLHPLFYSFLINKKSREKTLQFFTEALIRNKNRAQLQSDERVLAGDGFFVNLTNVLQLLSINIKRDKIDPYYPFHPENALAVKKDDSRIKMNCSDADKWLSELPSQSDFKWEEPSFSTQGFFQALYAHHLSVNRFIETASQTEQSSSTQLRLRRCKEQMLKYHKAKLCAEAGLFDERFLGRCIGYYNQFINLLFNVINCDSHLNVELPLPEEVPPLFASYPEW